MNIDLEAIQAAAKAAKPGPWEADGPSFGDALPRYLDEAMAVSDDEDFDCEAIAEAPIGVSDEVSTANMDFIAAANPVFVLEMVRQLREVRTELAHATMAANAEANYANELHAEVLALRENLTALVTAAKQLLYDIDDEGVAERQDMGVLELRHAVAAAQPEQSP